MPDAHYEKMCESFGARGFLCRSQEEIRKAFQAALKDDQHCYVLNILINPVAERKQQEFQWLTRAKI